MALRRRPIWTSTVALVDIDVVAPDIVEQLFAREDAAGRQHEEFEQTVFGGPMLIALPLRNTRCCSRSRTRSLGTVSKLGRPIRALPGAGGARTRAMNSGIENGLTR